MATHRKMLALLALLSVARDGGITREKLAALLWPESDEERARGALKQICYALRQAVGADVLASGPGELRLNPPAIASDVAEFEQALAGGDPARAVSLYAGPFLDGFYLKGAAEFEGWVEAQRTRLASAACRALGDLARAAADRRDLAAVVEWRSRLASLDPLDSRAALALMQALAAAGDRGAALRHAQVHESLLRQELDAPPDPDVLALVRELRVPAPAAESAPEPAPEPAP
ncbi:MAG TPA: BTAD domain-containing putative transcriptional regulator, partial [Gemmatimonadaceae bacterium]|nr:BTAD domain-containing putative transcriptional regulator [Gemmatimonadaceae bacterium]